MKKRKNKKKRNVTKKHHGMSQTHREEVLNTPLDKIRPDALISNSSDVDQKKNLESGHQPYHI